MQSAYLFQDRCVEINSRLQSQFWSQAWNQTLALTFTTWATVFKLASQSVRVLVHQKTVTLTSQSCYENRGIEYKLNVVTAHGKGLICGSYFSTGVIMVSICTSQIAMRVSFLYVGSYFIHSIIFIALFWKFQTGSSTAQRQPKACKILLSFSAPDRTDLPLQGLGRSLHPKSSLNSTQALTPHRSAPHPISPHLVSFPNKDLPALNSLLSLWAHISSPLQNLVNALGMPKR